MHWHSVIINLSEFTGGQRISKQYNKGHLVQESSCNIIGGILSRPYGEKEYSIIRTIRAHMIQHLMNTNQGK